MKIQTRWIFYSHLQNDDRLEMDLRKREKEKERN